MPEIPTAPRGDLRGRFGGFLGSVPDCAAPISPSITFRLSGGKSIKEVKQHFNPKLT